MSLHMLVAKPTNSSPRYKVMLDMFGDDANASLICEFPRTVEIGSRLKVGSFSPFRSFLPFQPKRGRVLLPDLPGEGHRTFHHEDMPTPFGGWISSAHHIHGFWQTHECHFTLHRELKKTASPWHRTGVVVG